MGLAAATEPCGPLEDAIRVAGAERPSAEAADAAPHRRDAAESVTQRCHLVCRCRAGLLSVRRNVDAEQLQDSPRQELVCLGALAAEEPCEGCFGGVLTLAAGRVGRERLRVPAQCTLLAGFLD